MELFVKLFGALGVTLVVITFLKRKESDKTEWRLLALVSFCVLPLLFAVGTLEATFNHMKTVDFCGSCHVMEPYVESLTYPDDEPLASVHYRNNLVSQKKPCYSCHVSYAMFGGVQAKLNGLRHVKAFVTKKEIEKIELYKPYSNDNCLHCHASSERFRKGEKHNEHHELGSAESFFDRVESGELSCLKAGCHDIAHYWEEEGDDDDW